MKLGISGQVLSETKSLEEILQILKKHDVKNIEIWPCNISGTDNNSKICPDTYEGRDILKAKDILKEYGIAVACVSMSAAFNREISSNVEVYASALRYTVEVAKELGASYVNHYCYYLCLEEASDAVRMMKYWEPALNLAEREGIVMCLENEAHDATRTPVGMYRIIEQLGSKNFKTNYDATNYYHAGQEGFPHGYDVLKDHIAYVHIKNGCIYDPDSGHSEKSKGTPMTGAFASNNIYYPPIPEGAVNIDGLLLRLERDGYDGFCVLEPHTTAENAEGYYFQEVGYLRNRGFFI